MEDNDDGIRQNTNGSFHFFGADSINLKDLPPCPEYISLGPPSKQCKFCGAIMWNEERVNKRVKNGDPLFSICCCKGQVSLPKVEAVPQYLSELYSDPVRGPPFLQNIRVYNSMVCMTSNGGKIDHSINRSRGPYVYKILGLHYHQYGSLMPDDDKTPKFCQLYIYDTQNEVNNRMRAVNKDNVNAVDADVLKGLLDMLDQINPLVKKFRMARDRFEKDNIVDLKIVMKVSRTESGRENNVTDGDEVAALIVGEPGYTCGKRDILIQNKMDHLERISDVHPLMMPLQYPVLFPRGEDGFHEKIKYSETNKVVEKKREYVSIKEFYSYQFHIRPDEGI